MSQEVSVDLDPVIDFDLKSLDEVSEIDFDPSLFYWGLNFGHFNLYLLQVCDFVVEEIKIGNELATIFQKDVFSFDFFFSFHLFYLGLVFNQKFVEAFFWVFNPQISILSKVTLDILSIFDDQVQIMRYL